MCTYYDFLTQSVLYFLKKSNAGFQYNEAVQMKEAINQGVLSENDVKFEGNSSRYYNRK